MKVRVEIEVDLDVGTYDVKYHNLSKPGGDIDMHRINIVAARVLENVAAKTERPTMQAAAKISKLSLN